MLTQCGIIPDLFINNICVSVQSEQILPHFNHACKPEGN